MPISPRPSCAMPWFGWPKRHDAGRRHRCVRRSRFPARDRISRRVGKGTERQSAWGLRRAHAKRAQQLLQQLGLAVETHEVPRAAVEAAGMKSVTNLIVRHRFGDGRVVALNAHGDVVPPGLGWRLDPYGAVIEDGARGAVMYGRGVAVSKSDFASYTWALLALKAAVAQGGELGGTLELHFTYDEEAGGIVGPKWLLDQGLARPDAVIAAGFSYSVVTAHNGCLHLEVTVTGKQAHAAMPEAGVDALEATNAILTALYAHRATLARIRSGTEGIVSPTL